MRDYSKEMILTGFARELMLAEICRRLDIILMCNWDRLLGMQLRQTKGNTYLGNCPFCREEKCFTLNRKTGAGGCAYCRKTVDFLDLMAHYRNGGMFAALNFIEILIEGNDRRKAGKPTGKKTVSEQRASLQGGAA